MACCVEDMMHAASGGLGQAACMLHCAVLLCPFAGSKHLWREISQSRS